MNIENVDDNELKEIKAYDEGFAKKKMSGMGMSGTWND